MLAAVGATMLASDEIEEFIKKLVERGELAEQDARKLMREVLDRRERVAKERKMEQEHNQPVTVTRADIDSLNARLEELSRKLDNLSQRAMRTIKRYTNRKLYDSQERRYITLEELATLIRQGEEIEVRDHISGADLTTLVMMQTVLDQERREGSRISRKFG
jgi:polyhydroxyalkanoate synthesis regulator phasin